MLEKNTNETDNQHPSNLFDKMVEGSTVSKVTSLVECEICHKKMKDLTNHLNKHHKVTCKWYLDNYPDSKIMTDELKQKRHDLYTKAVMSGKTSETCAKGGNKTAQTRKENGTASDFGKYINSFADLSNPDRCKKISETKKKIFRENPEELKKYQDTMRENQKIWKNILDNMTPEDLELFINTSFLGGYKLKEFEYKGKKYRMRSSYERRFAIMLIDNNIEFQYEPFFLRYNKKNYLPDFVIDKHVFEIKSLYWLNRNNGESWVDLNKRIQCCKHHGFEFTLITETELNNPDIMKSIIGKIQKCTTESHDSDDMT